LVAAQARRLFQSFTVASESVTRVFDANLGTELVVAEVVGTLVTR
jgi:hypothetical protein